MKSPFRVFYLGAFRKALKSDSHSDPEVALKRSWNIVEKSSETQALHTSELVAAAGDVVLGLLPLTPDRVRSSSAISLVG